MTTYLVNALLILLMLVLFGRRLIGWLKERKKWVKIAVPVLILAFSAVDIFFLTLYETIFCLGIILVVFLLRKDIFGFLKRVSEKKLGRLKASGCVLIGIFGIWLSLAVFYRTDIGMPIGVKNYLYHKYNEEFEVSGFFGATIAGHPTNQLTCCPKNGNTATDSFNVVRKNTLSVGSRRFASDNYYGIIIREDYEKYVSDIVSKYFDEFKVFVQFEFSGISNAKYMSDEFDKNTSLEEFFNYQKNDNNIRACNTASIDIFLKEQPTINEKDNIIEKIQSFCSDLQNELNYLNVYFAVFDKDSKYNYDSLTLNNYCSWNNPNNWDYSPRYIYFGLNYKSEIIYFEIDERFFILEEE